MMESEKPFRVSDYHSGQTTLMMGPAIEDARAGVILLHGRNASASNMLTLAQELQAPDVVFMAPQARSGAWYPQSFLSPIELNEPWLTSALEAITRTLDELNAGGLALEKVAILGFSQGACLGIEYAARNPRRYGGVMVLSGGLIGDQVERERYSGSFEGTPVYFGLSSHDPFIPLKRARESAEVVEALQGVVTFKPFAEPGHSVTAEEIIDIQAMVDSLISPPTGAPVDQAGE